VVRVTNNPRTPDTANPHHRALLEQRRGLLLSDFPNLGRIFLQAGHQVIASNIHELITEQQVGQVVKAASKVVEATKTKTKLLGAVGNSVLLRLAQVAGYVRSRISGVRRPLQKERRVNSWS